jgi:hypothetical protein
MGISSVPAGNLAPQIAQNILVNPGFEIWQRGTGPFGATNGATYSSDEWVLISGGPTITLSAQRDSSPLYGNYCMEFSASAIAVGSHTLTQGIEMYKELEGQWVTLSMWLKTATADNAQIYIQAWNGTSADTTLSDLHDGDDTWQQFTVVQKLPASMAPTANHPHNFGLSVGVNINQVAAPVFIDGAALVIGEYRNGVAYLPLNPTEDTQRCERFYEIGEFVFATAWSGSGLLIPTQHVTFHTPKYAVPTLTYLGFIPLGPPVVAPGPPFILDTSGFALSLDDGAGGMTPGDYAATGLWEAAVV